MKQSTRHDVKRRAEHRCEYCGLPQSLTYLSHQLDHIIAEKHAGLTVVDDLALSCYSCNNHKGPNISGIDPLTGRHVKLFNPRRQKWPNHFRWEGTMLVGITPIGRASIEVLAINMPSRVSLRESLQEEGRFPW